ncbi:MAG: hypothetical protein ACW98F_15225, partial [Candidatus Hodarchaeales archaeon]
MISTPKVHMTQVMLILFCFPVSVIASHSFTIETIPNSVQEVVNDEINVDVTLNVLVVLMEL